MMFVPHRTPSFLPHLFPSSLAWRFPDAQRELYLTFDDGPVPGPTDFVIDTLRKFNCDATFFCIGDNIKKNPQVFSRIKENGFAIGNHTFNHLNGWKNPNDRYLANIRQCDEYIGDTNNNLFRPPYGRITWSQIRGLPDKKIIMWDVLSLDYEKRLRPEKCFTNSISATRRGSIIVFHDSFKAEKNMMYALPRFIEHFLEQGFVFRRIE
jgi:peptidoglycan/xylan/chitin deacetylase (PgdA/CDA1 family)